MSAWAPCFPPLLDLVVELVVLIKERHRKGKRGSVVDGPPLQTIYMVEREPAGTTPHMLRSSHSSPFPPLPAPPRPASVKLILIQPTSGYIERLGSVVLVPHPHLRIMRSGLTAWGTAGGARSTRVWGNGSVVEVAPAACRRKAMTLLMLDNDLDNAGEARSTRARVMKAWKPVHSGGNVSSKQETETKPFLYTPPDVVGKRTDTRARPLPADREVGLTD
ncbi:hypothetical protein DFH09DRAFT_1082478 [Mycena vulgaris]|nr:hypothetical protein DFH09DRAFT_1082478 [Mycena vulgaris]